MTQIEPRSPFLFSPSWPQAWAKRPKAAAERLEVGKSRLRLQTITRLRWVAVIGQLATVLSVHLLLGFELPLLACLSVIALSALLNLYMQTHYLPSKRLMSSSASLLLAYDLLQLTALLYLTGGLQNPFALLMVVPVAISASTQPLRLTAVLCALSIVCASLLIAFYMPLPWAPGAMVMLPLPYMIGVWTALVSCIVFMTAYAWRTAQENRQMFDALAATELRLAREQKLSALDGLAAAAAHELGTPLSTISLVAKELEREIPLDSPLRDDITLLRSQAARCRDILSTLTQHSGESDAMFSQMSLGHLIEEAIQPFRAFDIALEVTMLPFANGQGTPQPVLRRNPGIIYGLTNLVENAVDYASSRVVITAYWDSDIVSITIADDGPGFAPNVLGRLGEPFVTTRAKVEAEDKEEAQGMGLGIFIAKTLLERSGAVITLQNREAPESGAQVQVVWRTGDLASI
jgi:two-component system, sensor histidine kinase RegB